MVEAGVMARAEPHVFLPPASFVRIAGIWRGLGEGASWA